MFKARPPTIPPDGNFKDMNINNNLVINGTLYNQQNTNINYKLINLFQDINVSDILAIKLYQDYLLISNRNLGLIIFKYINNQYIYQTNIVFGEANTTAIDMYEIDSILYIAIGNIFYYVGMNQAGCVHIFTGENNIWTLQTTLFGSDNISGRMGKSVSMYNNLLITGGIGENGGAAWIFRKDINNTWTQVGDKIPGFNIADGTFGSVVKLYQNRAIISDPTDINGQIGQGKIYIFDINDNDWTILQTIGNDNSNGILGYFIGFDLNTLVFNIGNILNFYENENNQYNIVNNIKSINNILITDNDNDTINKLQIVNENTIAYLCPSYTYILKKSNNIWIINQILNTSYTQISSYENTIAAYEIEPKNNIYILSNQ